MTSLGQKVARLAQAAFILSMLILAFGFVHLFSSGGNPSSRVVESHMPYVYAFELSIGASIILAIVATVLNLRANAK